jgi:hypothetical protein
VASLDAPVALPVIGDAIEKGEPAGYEALVVRFAPARARSERVLAPARACAVVAELASLVAAHRAQADPEVLGPFDPALVVETDDGDRVIAPGLAKLAITHDQGVRGLRGGTRLSHYRSTVDQIRDTPGLPHEVTCLAVLLVELVAGREPYPTDSEFAYLTAVSKGEHDPIDTLAPRLGRELRRTIERALRVEAASRPSLEELRAALLAEPGARERTSTPEAEPPPRRPWWKLW